ncbi:RIIa domain-containing protein 1-like [Styela clava]
MARPSKRPPFGMEDYDLGALSDEQQASLNMYKIKTRMENEEYLRKHPEVGILMTTFLRELLLRRPNNVREFAAVYFTNSELPSSTKLKLLHLDKQT